MLAHKAEEEGIAVVENILGEGGHVDAFRDLCTYRVVLVRRDRNGREDADDRHDDHQLDQRKAGNSVLSC